MNKELSLRLPEIIKPNSNKEKSKMLGTMIGLPQTIKKISIIGIPPMIKIEDNLSSGSMAPTKIESRPLNLFLPKLIRA